MRVFRLAFRKAPQRGFTILEILVVIAITAILLSLAIPSYQQYMLRGHRAEAAHALLAMANCQERVRAGTGYYDTSQCLGQQENERYDYSISPTGNNRALEFIISAIPRQDPGGDDCGSLSLDQAGTRSITGDKKHLSSCWGGR